MPYQGWLEKCSKDEISPPLPSKVKNILTPTSVISSYYNVALKYNYNVELIKVNQLTLQLAYKK